MPGKKFVLTVVIPAVLISAAVATLAIIRSPSNGGIEILMEKCLQIEKPKAKGEDQLNYTYRLCWMRAMNGFKSKEK